VVWIPLLPSELGWVLLPIVATACGSRLAWIGSHSWDSGRFLVIAMHTEAVHSGTTCCIRLADEFSAVVDSVSSGLLVSPVQTG
jgi:hypothetical protein